MNKRIFLLILFSAFTLLCVAGGNVFAMNTDFSTEDMQPENQKSFLSNLNLHLITEEPKKNTIKCFDVNDNGLIVIGCEDFSKKTVSVYSEAGIFKYGYVFEDSGSFGVEWDGDNIIIYFVRSDVAASFDPLANNVELRKIQNTTDNNFYWNYSVFSEHRTISTNEYTIKNNMGFFNIFSSSYDQLIKTDEEGNTTIIYDAGNGHMIKIILILIVVFVFAGLVIYRVILEFKKAKEHKMQ